MFLLSIIFVTFWLEVKGYDRDNLRGSRDLAPISDLLPSSIPDDTEDETPASSPGQEDSRSVGKSWFD